MSTLALPREKPSRKPAEVSLHQVGEAGVGLGQQGEVVALVADLLLDRLAILDEVGLEADDRLDPVLLAGLVEIDGAVHHAVVGQPQRRLAELRRPRRHRVDLAGAVEQRVLAVGVQMDGLGGQDPPYGLATDGAAARRRPISGFAGSFDRSGGRPCPPRSRASRRRLAPSLPPLLRAFLRPKRKPCLTTSCPIKESILGLSFSRFRRAYAIRDWRVHSSMKPGEAPGRTGRRTRRRTRGRRRRRRWGTSG